MVKNMEAIKKEMAVEKLCPFKLSSPLIGCWNRDEQTPPTILTCELESCLAWAEVDDDMGRCLLIK